VLYAGRVDERKGIATAVEALAALPAETTLVIQGGGDEDFGARLREQASALGVADRVEFRAPSRDDLAASYAECDALLFPVIWDEPWGLVPLEAMSVGRPVVATGTGGSAEYLRDRENCLLFEPRDAAALAAAVRRLADSADLRARLVAGGRETAGRFTEQAFNDLIERELRARVSSASRIAGGA
jgi:glycosyltransferase involved in cell wall biosynthesis